MHRTTKTWRQQYKNGIQLTDQLHYVLGYCLLLLNITLRHCDVDVPDLEKSSLAKSKKIKSEGTPTSGSHHNIY